MDKVYEIDYHRNDYDLQKFAIFCICVANKNADVIAQKVDDFCYGLTFQSGETPLTAIKEINDMSPYIVPWYIKLHRLSPYNKNIKAILDLAKSSIDLRTCTVDELESISGIGPKTARFFILFSRENTRDIAVLDTHILRWLGKKGYDVPTSTPSGKRYKELEQLFLSYWKQQELPLAEFDFSIWKEMRGDNGRNDM